jgi:hypothetical protein
MLGRLKMSVDEVIAAYKTVMGQVFVNKAPFYEMIGSGSLLDRGYYYDSTPLVNSIKAIVKKSGQDPEVKLNINDPVNPPKNDCKV